jgi:hypothetical protein
MIAECPHCFTNVVPKADGACPACLRDMHDTCGTDSSRSSVRLSQGEELPGICYECGQVTDRFCAVTCSSCKDHDQPSGIVQALIVFLISWPLALYFLLRGISNASVVQVRLPQCGDCAARGKPEPRYVDFGNVTMTFIVHKNLKHALATRGTVRGANG